MVDVKEYLGNIRLIDTKINAKLDDLARTKAVALKVTTTLRQDAGSGGGGNHDKIGDAVAKMIDLEGEINRAVDAYIEMKREIGAVVDRLENAAQIEVLYKHYFGVWSDTENRPRYLTLEEIAVEMHMSYRNVCYIHGAALQAVAAILKERESNV